MKDLAAALAKAQAAMKPALKDSTNPHFKSKYADLTSVWEACRDALTKNGLSVAQVTEFDGELTWIRTILLHSSGEMLEGRYPLRPVQNTPQGMGSAMSYARRYALAAMVGVVADDDDGQAASTGNGQAYEPAPQPTKAQTANDARNKAIEYANNAHHALGKMKTMDELNAWLGKNGPALEKLREKVPEEFTALDDKINVTADRLNTLVAG